MELSERKQRILSAIVEQYIATGEPVGSKLLCAALGMTVSSATIRNEMSELAEMGLLDQPHTSAGRIPSHLGYRYYVDNLMNRHELGEEQRRRMEERMMIHAGDPEQLLEQAGEILANITNCAAVTTTPKDETAVIKKVDMLPIGHNNVMLMLVTSNGIVRTRGYRVRSAVTQELAETFASVTQQTFIGKHVEDINLVLIKRLAPLLGENSAVIQELLIALAELAWDAAKEEILLEGQANILNHREYEDNAYELLNFLNQEDNALSSLFSPQDSGAIHVIIGRETEIPELENSSVIMARYQVSGHRGGTLGIIGPTRIDYAKMIPNIEYLTSLVSRLLSDAFGDGNQLSIGDAPRW